ncbi:TIR domain-containing protein [Lentzea fradiae]|uniref:TIR domain-containing protein n=1 Tax=Lentzea fradiae TaxID=200378 RepID=UPI000B7E0709|nr:TIR domain-containing protein [Lentzea fradiae]
MSGYKYDFFISYCRHGSVQRWLLNHFLDKLRECLADQYAPTPTVYVDRSMERGVHWPSNLQDALRHSKIMIQLLTPQYYESRWCMAEQRSMRAREEMLGLASVEVSQGLIYPILYSDSDNFPPEEKERSWVNFKDVAHPDPVYQQSKKYLRFHTRVNQLAEDLVRLAKQAPPWQPDWPDVDPPQPPLMPPPQIPRF